MSIVHVANANRNKHKKCAIVAEEMMTDIELIKQEIDNLEKLANEIEDWGFELLDTAPLIYKPALPGVVSGFPDNEWGTIDPDLRNIQRTAIRKYQKFHSGGLHFVKEFLPEKEVEFQIELRGKGIQRPRRHYGLSSTSSGSILNR